MTSPQTLWRGNRECSKRATRSPRWAHNAAAVAPPGPPPTTITSKSPMAGQNDAGVDASKTKAIGENAIHPRTAARVGDAVKAVLRIRLRQVERRRQVIVFQRQAANGDLDCPGSA